MYLGRLVELCESASLYAAPMHPYSEAVLSAVPIPDPRRSAAREQIVLQGDVPSPAGSHQGGRPAALDAAKHTCPSHSGEMLRDGSVALAARQRARTITPPEPAKPRRRATASHVIVARW